jgi:hypothetical protein
MTRPLLRDAQMKQRIFFLLCLLTVVAVAVAPGTTLAGASSDNLIDLATRGGASASLGFGVSPLHWELIAPLPGVSPSTAAENRTLAERESFGRAVSLDFKLRWPTADLGLEPYLVIGPALLVEQPHDPSDLIGPPADPSVRLGAKAGAGFNWRLTNAATLFGSYDITTSGADALSSSRTRMPASGLPTEHELLYGVRFRY